MGDFLSAVGSIILLDLVLSGDNALVIGAVAAELPKRQRFSIILIGGLGAVIPRILLTYLATVLLGIQWLQTAGAIVLLVIAVRLIMERYHNDEQQTSRAVPEAEQQVAKKFWAQALTVLVADLTMSLDNTLAIGAIAHGDLLLLTVGLLLALIFLLLGSSVVAAITERFRWLIDGAALVLAWTSGSMILNDLQRSGIDVYIPGSQVVVPLFAITVIVVAEIFLYVRMRTQKQQSLMH